MVDDDHEPTSRHGDMTRAGKALLALSALVVLVCCMRGIGWWTLICFAIALAIVDPYVPRHCCVGA